MSPTRVRVLCLLTATLGLAGCTASHISPATTAVHPAAQPALLGRAMGGEQPITGAAVHLYMVGNTGVGSQATDILTNPVTTSDGTGVGGDSSNANNTMAPGFFTITSDYTCPTATFTSDDLVYLATVGGNPGGGENDSQVNLVALGHCKDLPSVPFVVINEITTVGTVAALFNYMPIDYVDVYGVNYNSIGSNSEDSGFAAAFTTAAEYMSYATGTAPGPALPSGYDASSNDVRALANAVQSCVNSVSDTATNLSTTCENLFDDVSNNAYTYPNDTVYALFNLFNDPTDEVPEIFDLQTGVPPFAPTNAIAPPDWTLPILPIPATPTFSPNPALGTYNSTQPITITDSTPDTTIFYTTDGSTPTVSSTIYYGGFNIISSGTVKAIAIENNRISSSVGSAAYTINTVPAAAPMFSPAAGTYTTGQTVTLSDSTALYAHYYYTTDGSTPTAASIPYTGPITVSANETLKAVAYASVYGYGLSSVSTASYIIGQPVSNAISTVAGSGNNSYYGDGVYATAAQISSPQSVKLYNGYAYIAAGYLRRVDLNSGIITTVQSPPSGYASDVTFDSAGNLYYSETFNGTAAIYEVNATTGVTTTYLGGNEGSTGENGPASAAKFSQLWGIVMDASGDFYFVDTGLNKVFMYYNGGSDATTLLDNLGYANPTVGYVYRIAGVSAGTAGDSGDGVLATSTTINAPAGICLDPSGNIVFSEYSSNVVRKITISTGMISKLAGNVGQSSFSDMGDGSSATGPNARLNSPVGVTYDTSGNLYIADSTENSIRKVNTSGILSTVVTGLGQPRGVAVDPSGNIYAANHTGNTVTITNTSGVTSDFAGSGAAFWQAGFGGPATQAELYYPQGVAVDPSGNLFIADPGYNRVFKVDSATGYITLYAGLDTQNLVRGGNGTATTVGLGSPNNLATDSSGNLYINDPYNFVVRKVDISDYSTVIAGQVGSSGYSGDGAAATSAQLSEPQAIAVDAAGNVFIADSIHCIREVTASNGSISTFAGNCSFASNSGGFAGDGGPATASGARLNYPAGLAVSSSDDLYFTDGNRVRMVYGGGSNAFTLLTALGIASPVVGDLYTIAGNGTYGSAGDGDVATNSAVEIGNAVGIVVDASGNIYFVTQNQNYSQIPGDGSNVRVRRIDGTTGVITTYVDSTGTAGFGGDGGTASNAYLFAAYGMAIDTNGNLYIADSGNRRIRMVAH